VRFHVAQQRGLSNAHSPFRVVDQTGREVGWVNRYLDQQRVRGVADTTLRSYAHDLLHFVRWWTAAHETPGIAKETLREDTFLDYIRFQPTVGREPQSAPCGVSFPTRRVFPRRPFRIGIGGNHGSAMAGHARH